MNAVRIVAIVLIVLGAVGLAYGGFTYTKDRHEMQVGPVQVTVSEERSVPIPLWAGIAAVVVGVGLLLVPAKKG